MNDHPLGLVYDGGVLVLINHVEGNVFRGKEQGGRFLPFQNKGVARADEAGQLCRLAVYLCGQGTCFYLGAGQESQAFRNIAI
jgi:hypothetical protein